MRLQSYAPGDVVALPPLCLECGYPPPTVFEREHAKYGNCDTCLEQVLWNLGCHWDIVRDDITRENAWRDSQLNKLSSPLERRFWGAHYNARHVELSGLVCQHPVLGGRFRLDFALPSKKIGIELDGYTYHSSREMFNQDRYRQRRIEREGWRIIRFSGDEINADVLKCLDQTVDLVRAWTHG